MGNFEDVSTLSATEKLSQKLKNSNYYSQLGDIKVKVDACKEGGIEIKIGTRSHRHTNSENLENSNLVPNLSEIRKKLNSREFSISSEFEDVSLDSLPTPHCNCSACITLMESLMSSILKQQNLAEATDGKASSFPSTSALKDLLLCGNMDASSIPPHALYEHIQAENQRKYDFKNPLVKDRPIPLSDKVENIPPNISGTTCPHVTLKPCQRLPCNQGAHAKSPELPIDGPRPPVNPSQSRESGSSVMVKIGTSHGSLTISSKKKIICQKTTEISTQTAQETTPQCKSNEECSSDQQKAEIEIKRAGCQGTPVDGCQEDHSDSSSKTKFCACCYCELVGHSGPHAPQNSHNYEQIKEKLRKKLEKRFPDKPNKKDQKEYAPLDDRPVEDLVSFIEGDTDKEKSKPKKKKKPKVQKDEKILDDSNLPNSCSVTTNDPSISRKRDRTPEKGSTDQNTSTSVVKFPDLPITPQPEVSSEEVLSSPTLDDCPTEQIKHDLICMLGEVEVLIRDEDEEVKPVDVDVFSEQLEKFRNLPHEKKLELLCNKKFEHKLVENLYNYQQQLLRSIQTAKDEENNDNTPLNNPQIDSEPQSGKKKNKKKKKRNETVDDIFMPRLDLDDVEILDESERELENFKKFCMDKQPCPQRQKIQLNVKNLNMKKLTN